jgi:hypothetical protein
MLPGVGFAPCGTVRSGGRGEVFRALVLARIIEPTSNLDSLRVMEDNGCETIGSVSYRGEGAKAYNALIRGVHAPSERANSLLTTSFNAMRRVSLDSWRIGAIAKAALVLLHLEHDRSR